MRNLSIFVRDNKGTVHLDETIIGPSVMTLRHATVFWRYENVTSSNNTISYGSKVISFGVGYWDFEMIREKLSSENIILSRSIPDRKCSILSKGDSLSLKSFGILLGFDKDTVIASNTLTGSDRPVDVLGGLRYINVNCDAVNIRESTNSLGGRSTILSSLPIVSYETLNSSATNYFDINSSATLYSGNISSLRFTIDSNIGGTVGADVLLNIVVE